MGLGVKLTQLMEMHGTHVSDLARKIDVAPQTLHSIIKRDSTRADINILSKIAKVYGVDLDYFADDAEPLTLAAHFDGKDYTEDELDEIRQFAEFVKKKRASK